jgi:hypothetical protein
MACPMSDNVQMRLHRANTQQASTFELTSVRNTGFTVLYEPAKPKEAIAE